MTGSRHAERGLSLVEVLVATTILALVVVIALTVYDQSRQAFARGENAVEQQEAVRIAFDKLTTDIRMLGFNVNPDGNPTRTDEQLEGALDHAIVLRADFDRSDSVASRTPETSLAGGAYATVSTGNDEIVAYVLARPDGSGPDTITFQADVREPVRDGSVEPVTIGNVVLNPTSPPYTLYRVTLNNDSSTYGSSSFVVRTPVMENVRELSFVYHDAAGTFKDPSATISESPSAKAIRSGLTRVSVSLVGMTRQQDLAYDDPNDPAAPRFRKFELRGDVTPRNMRLKGFPDVDADVTPPSKPATPTVIPGHCGGLIVVWAPNPGGEHVTQYRIGWGPSSSVIAGTRNVPGSPFFLDGLANGTTTYVSVQAQDAAGNVSVRSDLASATVTNLNAPSTPTGFTTSTDRPYGVYVSWTPVTTNSASVPAADPAVPRIRDLAGYRLYSYPYPGFDLDDATKVADERVLGPSFQPPYEDTPLVACNDRYYMLTAVDTCGRESDPTPSSRGRLVGSGVKASPPTNVQAHFTGPGAARVRWTPTTSDVAGKAIEIDRYEVFRSDPIDGALPPASATWGPTRVAAVYNPVFDDPAVPALAPDQVVWYRVIATDYCGNNSDYSAEAKLECAFGGDVQITRPRDGGTVSGAVTTVVAAPGCTNCMSTTITYVHRVNGLMRTFTSNVPGTTWTDTGWTALPVGDYTITAAVTTFEACTATQVVGVTAIVAPEPPP